VEHADFMSRAIELARSGSGAGHGGPFGCVVVKEGKIVGEGFNQVLSAADPTAHGEIVALRSAARALGTHDLQGCTVYNISVPCPMCLAAMYWARVSKVYFCCMPSDAAAIGFDNAEIAQQLAKPLESQSLPMQQLSTLYPSARAVYDEWARSRARRY
jgi:tRNA(Arg) A34 adenosine deaminase TadA